VLFNIVLDSLGLYANRENKIKQRKEFVLHINLMILAKFSLNFRKPRNCLRTVTFILNVRDAEEEEEEDEGDFPFKLRLVRP